MLHNLQVAAMVLLFTATAHAQITGSLSIDRPRDAATNETGIAPGSMFIVKGNFAAPVGLKLAPLPLPTSFNGISLSLVPDSGSVANPIQPYIYYIFGAQQVTSNQLAAVMPSSTPPGRYTLRLTTGSETASAAALVVATKFRLLANNQNGYSTAVVQDQNYNRVLFTAPAHPGDILILWGLGLGPISAADNVAPGPINLQSKLDVHAAVGGIDAPVLYAGRAPAFPGIDQINIVVPPNAPTGCNVALGIIAAGQPSNPVTVPIARPGAAACSHPYLTSAQLGELERGRTFRTGQFHFMIYSEPYRDIPFVQIHSALGFFNEYAAEHAGAISPASVAPGRCVGFQGSPYGIGPGYASRLFLDAPLDDSYYAGEVTVSGGALPSVPLTGGNAYYYRLFSAFREDTDAHVSGTAGQRFTVGAQILEGPGSSDIGPFQASLQLPQVLVWSNRSEIVNIPRSVPLTLNWSGGSPRDPVFIQGATGTDDSVNTFLCVAPAGATSFTVPPAVLQTLPAMPGFLRVAAFGPGVAFPASFAPGPNTLNYLYMTTIFATYR